MSLHSQLLARQEAGRPIRVGLIGAGKFGTMFLAQARRTLGLHVMVIADLMPERAVDACERAGWPDEACAAASFEAAIKSGGTTRRAAIDRVSPTATAAARHNPYVKCD